MVKLEVGMMVACGLQLMTVAELDPPENTARCIWFNTEGEFQEQWFPAKLLMAVRLDSLEY